jgi:hypothetical protein
MPGGHISAIAAERPLIRAFARVRSAAHAPPDGKVRLSLTQQVRILDRRAAGEAAVQSSANARVAWTMACSAALRPLILTDTG